MEILLEYFEITTFEIFKHLDRTYLELGSDLSTYTHIVSLTNISFCNLHLSFKMRGMTVFLFQLVARPTKQVVPGFQDLRSLVQKQERSLQMNILVAFFLFLYLFCWCISPCINFAFCVVIYYLA